MRDVFPCINDFRVDDVPAERVPQGIGAEADAQDQDFPANGADRVDGYPASLGVQGPEKRIAPAPAPPSSTDKGTSLRITFTFCLSSPGMLDEVEGEQIVIVDDQDHARPSAKTQRRDQRRHFV